MIQRNTDDTKKVETKVTFLEKFTFYRVAGLPSAPSDFSAVVSNVDGPLRIRLRWGLPGNTGRGDQAQAIPPPQALDFG